MSRDCLYGWWENRIPSPVCSQHRGSPHRLRMRARPGSPERPRRRARKQWWLRAAFEFFFVDDKPPEAAKPAASSFSSLDFKEGFEAVHHAVGRDTAPRGPEHRTPPCWVPSG